MVPAGPLGRKPKGACSPHIQRANSYLPVKVLSTGLPREIPAPRGISQPCLCSPVLGQCAVDYQVSDCVFQQPSGQASPIGPSMPFLPPFHPLPPSLCSDVYGVHHWPLCILVFWPFSPGGAPQETAGGTGVGPASPAPSVGSPRAGGPPLEAPPRGPGGLSAQLLLPASPLVPGGCC